MKPATALVRPAGAVADPYRASTPPLYQTATFDLRGAEGYDYSRSGNPTREELEARLAQLEGGGRALAYTSGLAALTSVLRILRPGDRIVAALDIYGGTCRLLEKLVAPFGIEVEFCEATDVQALRKATDAGARIVLVETPGNPMLNIVDLKQVAAVCRDAGSLLVVDASMMTGLRMRPLDLGADLVVHSATKFLGGHADLTAGVVVGRDATLMEQLDAQRNAEGTALAPFEAWLLHRGLATLKVRLDAQERSARILAERLRRHAGVSVVHHVDQLAPDRRAVHEQQASGPGSVFSVETGCLGTSRRVLQAVRLLTVSVSFGGVASSINMPLESSHLSVPKHLLGRRHLPSDLLRISVGLEDVEDLALDLERAFTEAQQGPTAKAPCVTSEASE